MSGGRVAVILQPNYVPWIGYFDLMSRADVMVWYDDVQYTRRDWRNRNLLAGSDGEPRWITVPVKTKGRRDQPIREVEIDYGRSWVRKHLATFERLYAGAPFAAEVSRLLAAHLEREPARLADLTIGLCREIAERLGIVPAQVRSSEVPGIEGRGEARIVALCEAVGADVYLSGPAGAAYLSATRLAERGIALRYLEYRYPPYPRAGVASDARLSVLDPLAWIGAAAVRGLLRGEGPPGAADPSTRGAAREAAR